MVKCKVMLSISIALGLAIIIVIVGFRVSIFGEKTEAIITDFNLIDGRHHLQYQFFTDKGTFNGTFETGVADKSWRAGEIPVYYLSSNPDKHRLFSRGYIHRLLLMLLFPLWAIFLGAAFNEKMLALVKRVLQGKDASPTC